MPHPKPTLIIHGGAWAMPDDAIAAHENGIANALAAGYAILEEGGTAVSAVEAAVVVMEDDETFDAGRGSFLTRDGRVQLDALLMDGSNLRTGGVACVERLRNPIKAARLILDESPHVYFVGAGAERFARQHGMELCDNMDLVIPREQARLYAFQQAELAGGVDETFSGPASDSSSSLDKEAAHALESHDTVGAVALDIHGNIAAATSTGGTLSKAPGRVGDSSLIGCGCYADNLSAAVSLTGWGEPIMKLVLGKWAVDRVAAGVAPEDAAAQAIAYLYKRLGGHGGIILLAPDGRIGLAHNTPRMAWGIQTPEGASLGVARN
ncbi:beta-aspartyl-peptidase (threonine type) [Granulicella aggregans]|uniref:Isoaspartyl peptidase n=1 Tax=Granulicella aggregans TaxID=474949 RepID=A0A7W8E2N6_9BACT|nr:isoaspartyl peptidase/L-asparaginase [Granulicella aggregans]MBB5057078.1 beta-aspartyl-peptidase (threonine type) [Granulicella aggregans]